MSVLGYILAGALMCIVGGIIIHEIIDSNKKWFK